MRKSHPLAATALVVAVGLGAIGCGADDGDGDGEVTSYDSGDTTPAPADPEALAAVALEHLAIEPSAFEESSEAPPEAVGVNIRFDAGDGDDGDVLELFVGSGEPPEAAPECSDGSPCADLDSERGDLQLWWQPAGAEEPGGYQLILVTDEGYHAAFYSGDEIEGDPRDQEVSVAVADLAAVINDERFAATTTQGMVDAEVEGFPDDLR